MEARVIEKKEWELAVITIAEISNTFLNSEMEKTLADHM